MRSKLITLIYLLIVIIVIMATPTHVVLENDANSYYMTAINMVKNHNIVSSLFSASPQFIDHGYPTFLATIMQFVGTGNIVALQAANYLLWLVSSWVIYQSITLLGSKQAKWASLLMLFSPLYLTFSAKLYSEPFAALGTSLLIYGVVTMFKRPSLYGKFTLALGGIILFSTKSVLMPFILPLGIYLLAKRQFNYLLWLILVPVILFPSILGSLGGGRSLYTLNIQSSKLDQSYDQILACAPYYLSYPLGKAILPQYEGVCHQNDPTQVMPGYASNPYVLADAKRASGYDYTDWLSLILHHPIKYPLVMLVSLSNIVLFEGIYPSIILLLPLPFMFVGFVITKLALSAYLWISVYKVGGKNWILLIPLIYFALVVTNFPVEPRYFYPLVPYMYFLLGLSHNKSKSI